MRETYNLPPLALYVHWPWCLKKCPYCDFNSHVWNDIPERAYLDAVLKDIQHQASLVGPRRLVSIFFGGGTPSLMSGDTVKEIIDRTGELFDFDENIEISAEVNPTSATGDKLNEFFKAGINRFSIGIQSLNDIELKFLGREHSALQAIDAVRHASDICGNVNVDAIYGLPQQQLEAWEDQLNRLISLGTTHISAYQLTIEPNTMFYSQVLKKNWEPMSDDRQTDFFEKTQQILGERDFANYEISNFAKKGFECKHNLHVWRYEDYLGVGAGAHGRLHRTSEGQDGKLIATQNFKLPQKYMDAINSDAGDGMYVQDEVGLSREIEERTLMGLRLKDGVDLQPFGGEKNYPQDEYNEALNSVIDMNAVERVEHKKLLKVDNLHLKLTKDGWPLLDSVIEYIFKN